MMYKVLIMMMLSLTAAAQNHEKVALWAKTPPPHTANFSEPQSVNEWGHIVLCQNAELELFIPAGGAKKTVVICPGGGYQILAVNHEGRQFAEFLEANGIAAAVLSYRMPNGVHQIPLEDVAQALSYLRAESSKLKIDPNNIGIMGFSAGGHLAATASVHLDPAFSVLFYPVITFGEATHGGSRKNLTGGDSTLYNYYSAEKQVTAKTPPALIFHSTDDTAVPIVNAELYRDALRAQNIGVELVTFSTGGHGWGFNNDFVGHEQMKAKLLEWLKKLP